MEKVLITTSSFGEYENSVFDLFKNAGLSYELNPFMRKLTEDEVLDLVSSHDPVGILAGVEPLTERVFEAARKLKVVSRCGIGLDNVDMDSAEKSKIIVTNTPDGPTISVAELTLGLILTLLRQIHLSDSAIRQNKWYRPMGNLLHGKTVGIIGCGHIGTYLAKLVKPFNCKIIGYDPFVKQHEDIELVTVEGLVKSSDVISLHIPYSNETHHFINSSRLRMMKKEAVIINAARGGIVDEAALVKALEEKQIAGAALDCFELEPYKGELINCDKVLLTGHIGSYAIEGRISMELQSVKNLLANLKKTGCI